MWKGAWLLVGVARLLLSGGVVKKFVAAFFIVGTVLWLWARHETHLPCSVVRQDKTGGVWDCPAGKIAFTVKSNRARIAEISVTAPAVALFHDVGYVMGVGRTFVIHHARNETVVLDSKVPFSIILVWFPW